MSALPQKGTRERVGSCKPGNVVAIRSFKEFERLQLVINRMPIKKIISCLDKGHFLNLVQQQKTMFVGN